MPRTAQQHPIDRPDSAEHPEQMAARAAGLLHTDTPRALELAFRAQERADTGDTRLLAEIQRILGVGHAVTGDYHRAKDFFRKGLEFFESRGEHYGSAIMLTNTGNVCNFLGDYSSALEYYGRSLALCKHHGIERHLPSVYLNMGYSHRCLKQYDEAITALTHGLAATDRIGNRRTTAHILHNLGNIHLERGDYPAALHALGDSLAINTEVNNHHGMAAVLNDIGAIHLHLGNYGRALRHLKKSLDICERMGDKRGTALALNNIGDLYAHYGRHDSALRYFTASLAIKEELNNRADIARTLINIGKMYGGIGSPLPALDHCHRCIALAEELGDSHLLADALCIAAEQYRSLAKDARARTALTKALRLYSALGHVEGCARAQLALGLLHLAAGDTHKACTFLVKALDTAAATEAAPLLMRIHEALAQAYKEAEDTAGALRHYEQFHALERAIFAGEHERRRQHLLIMFDMEREQKNRELAEKEAGILRLENSRLEQEMAFRAKELVASAMYLTRKNAFLKKLHRSLRDLPDNLPHTVDTTIRALLREIDDAVNTEQSWTNFERQFRQVHQEYIERLAALFPDITPTELKVCALIKLNLSTKEIANILNTEPRSIEKYRQRIRKKLGLSQHDNLTSFLHSLH